MAPVGMGIWPLRAWGHGLGGYQVMAGEGFGEGRGGYRGMAQEHHEATFHIDRVTPRSVGGVTARESLSLARVLLVA